MTIKKLNYIHMKLIICILFSMFCIWIRVFSIENIPTSFRKNNGQIQQSIRPYVELYDKYSDISEAEKVYMNKEKSITAERSKILNQLAYITSIVRRSFSKKSFVMLKELKYRVERQDDYIKGVYYFVFGRLYFSINKKETAIQYNLKSIEYLKNCDRFDDLKNSYINQGFYLSHIDLKKALVYYQKAQKMEMQGIRDFSTDLHVNKVYWELMNNNLEAAYKEYKLANLSFKEASTYNYLDHCRILSALSSIYSYEGDEKKAQVIICQLKELAKKYHMISFQKDIAEQQRQYYYKNHNLEAAYTLLNEVDSLEKCIAIDKINEAVAVYDLKHKIRHEKKEKKRIQEIAGIQLKQKKILLFSLMAIILILGFITFLWLNIRLKNKVLVKQNLALAHTDPVRLKNDNTSDRKDVNGLLIVELEKLIFDKKLYQNSSLTIEKIAKKLNTNRTYLSEAINLYYKEGYSTWINGIRVSAARKLLASSDFDHYSIDGIAKMVGYTSISSFNSSFKKITGLTPSQFKKTRDIT